MINRKRKVLGASLGLIGALSGVAVADTAGPAVYGESATVKVRPNAQPKTNNGLSLAGARNEFVSFQVVINGGNSGVKGVSAKLDGLSGPSTIGGDDVTLYREEFLNISKLSTPDMTTGQWPDGLIPDVDPVLHQKRNAFPFDVAANQSRAIWVDVHVPDNAAPGTYQGQVEVSGDGVSQTVPVTLQVLNATLPSTSSLPSAYLLFAGNVCKAHTGTSDCGGVDKQNALVGMYEQLALDHRITLSNIAPFSGDGANFDSILTPYMDGTAPTQLQGAKMTSVQYVAPPAAATYAAFEDNLKSKGWLDRAYDYTGDEPPYGATFAQIQQRSALVKQNAPDLSRLVTTSVSQATQHGILDGIDILTPVINQMDGTGAPYQGDQRASYDSYLTGPNKKLWMYESCMSHGCAYGTNADGNTNGAGWPSYSVDTPATRNRAMQWEIFLENAGGELYYETANMLPTAWSDQFSFGGNGDGTLFYPGNTSKIGGTTAIPLPSIRLQLIRMGMQDYEWLKLVSDAGDPDYARQVAKSLLPSASKVPSDGTAFDSARAQLEARYVQLTGGDTSTPIPLSPTAPATSASAVAGSSGGGGGCGSSNGGAPAAAMGLMVPLFLFRRRRS